MKFKFTLLILLLSALLQVSFIATERDSKLIYWDQRPLTWDDFKGHGPSSSPYVAQTHSAIVLNFGGENNNVNFSVETVFYPKNSWKKKNVDAHVLKHEQGHFDLTEVYSRMLRKELQEAKFKKYETLSAEIQKIFNANYTACDNVQDLYDRKTDHSKKKDQQLLWDAKIESMLDSLANWSTPEFVIDVGYLIK